MSANTIKVCPGCGMPLPADAPAGLCPQCLLKSNPLTPAQTIVVTGAPTSSHPPIPVPGQTFGKYRILRLLGQGGMGEVYECEHIPSGRRVALKVMSHALAGEDDRKRFLREGRLAASVNHPNVVYVHGSEEIDGMPVIAMELARGGTLHDRLKRQGPLPIADAVAAILQMIDGLEAANDAGVLHRDIKPANCFMTPEGTVKIGDFGLSVSTLARGESLLTAAGSVMGTPAYASPEQLRGEELDVRSDIYSVGATLYHLLTGKTPYSATEFVKLITEVLEKQPAAPNALRKEIPPELSRIVLRCLAKDRQGRFQNYEQLRDALLPFRAAERVTANPARRAIAGIIDDLFAYGPSFLFLAYWSFDPVDHFVRERTPTAALIWIAFYAWYLLYYAIAEGIWGAAFGKTICGLRVIGPRGHAPGIPRAMLRTAIYMSPMVLPSMIYLAVVSKAEMRATLARGDGLVTDWLWWVTFFLLFVSMRRGNGYAAVHDLLSRTRVIVRPRTQPRPAFAASSREEDRSGEPLIGPYEIRSSLWKTQQEELLLGFDRPLRRNVWIHLRAASSPPLDTARRELSRPARLRWLNGGQIELQRWEAYEAPTGGPISKASWSSVRFWLLDLAEELRAALEERSTAPALSLQHVWMTAAGRALFLDFPTPTETSPLDMN
ncbi:MAG TPA: protein kinase, partial [Verrucomicrobiae bacterium]|nr:protein kinase [Verrucomicrobiae bacterium]